MTEPSEQRSHHIAEGNQVVIGLIDKLRALQEADVLTGEHGSSKLQKETNFYASRHARGRKKALIAVLDELTALQEQQSDSGAGSTSEGPDAFYHLELCVSQLTEELLKFARFAETSGAPHTIISLASTLRTRLQQILHLFRKNACVLFSVEVPTMDFTVCSSKQIESGVQVHDDERSMSKSRLFAGDIEDLSHQVKFLAEELVSFIR
ncbi:hypothetical protein FRC03_005318 [Tulasnella sp. 419]|nr:hypothetical protein FRC03_005318 [Tulasnella sp. 419]